MEIKPHKKYILRIDVGGKVLTYTVEVISVNNNFITFKDKFENVISYNLNNIVSYEELNGK